MRELSKILLEKLHLNKETKFNIGTWDKYITKKNLQTLIYTIKEHISITSIKEIIDKTTPEDIKVNQKTYSVSLNIICNLLEFIEKYINNENYDENKIEISELADYLFDNIIRMARVANLTDNSDLPWTEESIYYLFNDVCYHYFGKRFFNDIN